MEDSPPPVPPKDLAYHSGMESSQPLSSSTPASGSKRKRSVQDDTIYQYDSRNGHLEVAPHEGTPKRARSNAGVSDASDGETPAQLRSVRRKKGMVNLSRTSIRQAASMSNINQRQTSPVRGSKFQEGSLTDKPSEKPPSVYTRMVRTDSGNLLHVEELMADYHNDASGPADPMQTVLAYENATRDQRVADITAQQEKEEGGMFRFGKSIAAAFHPFALWSRLWNEEKEEMRRKRLEAERKARQKTEAEAKYAQLKSTGQIPFQHVSLQAPLDSAVAMDDADSTLEHRRVTSIGTVPQSQEDAFSREGSEVPETAPKPRLRGIRSRLHLRRPSMQDLRTGLKRVASDLNLAGYIDREGSSSASPTKTEFENTLRQSSQSKLDLKRQQRLSKRVSDLEDKLLKARSELMGALVEASPTPQTPSRYERFVPGTMRKPRFVPGALPTLPSEGVLFPEQVASEGAQEGEKNSQASRSRTALEDLNSAFDEEDDEETVRVSRERPYTRADELFHETTMAETASKLEEATIESGSLVKLKVSNQTNSLQDAQEKLEATTNNIEDLDANDKLINDQAEAVDDMDPHSLAHSTTAGASVSSSDTSYTDLDSKLKALDQNYKASRKGTKSKKRGSLDNEEKQYKPDAESDDDAEWEQATQKSKKRKSTGKVNGPNKRVSGIPKPKSPANKTPRKKSGAAKSGQNGTPKSSQLSAQVDVDMADAAADEDELPLVASARGSILSKAESLEPVYEESEEDEDLETTSTSIKVPIKDAPSRPTAKATPARFGRNSASSGMESSHKHSERIPEGSEEAIIVRAAQAAQHRRPSRSSSPSRENKVVTSESVSVVLARDDVPGLPKITGIEGVEDVQGGAEVDILRKGKKVTTKENYEWPDDVF